MRTASFMQTIENRRTVSKSRQELEITLVVIIFTLGLLSGMFVQSILSKFFDKKAAATIQSIQSQAE